MGASPRQRRKDWCDSRAHSWVANPEGLVIYQTRDFLAESKNPGHRSREQKRPALTVLLVASLYNEYIGWNADAKQFQKRTRLKQLRIH